MVQQQMMIQAMVVAQSLQGLNPMMLGTGMNLMKPFIGG